ncbi:MAG: site-specific integrase [Limnochordaceae bacterium]|nr:site-specific integrase [Limnochordaceae bacterium]
MGRRGNGEGTIYRRKDGMWAAQIVVGRKPDGRLDRRSVYGKTRAEVAEKLAKLQTARSMGSVPKPTKLSVAEYLDAWIENHKRFGGRGGHGLRPNTYLGYKEAIDKHIKPVIGTMRLTAVAPEHLEAIYRGMLDKKLSVRMAEIAHVTLHKAFKDAVTKGLLPANPCDRVPSPPRTRYRASDRPRLAWEQVPKVLDAVRDTRYYLPILLAMAAGLRRGEVLGLTWEHVDFSNGKLYVRQQWNRKDDGTWGLVPVKTKASVRDVPIPQDVADALAAHQVTQRAQFGNRWSPATLVFDRGDGKPINPADLDHAWADIREKLKLPEDLHLHDLRGSFATWHAQRKTDLKTVSEMLGHADVKVTLELYQSVTETMRKEAAQAIEGITKLRPLEPPSTA